MMPAKLVIDEVSRPPAAGDLAQLGELLADAVAGGASVSFMSPFSAVEAREWWRATIERADPRAIILVARDDEGIVGSVSMHPAWPPNQPHRADIAKLLVHRRARRRGIARALMAEIEARASAAGFTLLTLDTVRGDAADYLYAATGWQRVGIIPDYALYPDGRLCDVVLYYMKLTTETASTG